ncbi:MAG: M48 family metallopeptidase, partial [Proteobacteria bacterium]|nr:M48 family metallopeptidase [Pseudomonadota bacterium]
MTKKAAFKGLVTSWAKRLKVKPHQVRIQKMSSKWGSCSTL